MLLAVAFAACWQYQSCWLGRTLRNLTFYELLVRKQSQAGGLGHCGDMITLIGLKDLRFPKKLGASHRRTPHIHTLFSSACSLAVGFPQLNQGQCWDDCWGRWDRSPALWQVMHASEIRLLLEGFLQLYCPVWVYTPLHTIGFPLLGIWDILGVASQLCLLDSLCFPLLR